MLGGWKTLIKAWTQTKMTVDQQQTNPKAEAVHIHYADLTLVRAKFDHLFIHATRAFFFYYNLSYFELATIS